MLISIVNLNRLFYLCAFAEIEQLSQVRFCDHDCSQNQDLKKKNLFWRHIWRLKIVYSIKLFWNLHYILLICRKAGPTAAHVGSPSHSMLTVSLRRYTFPVNLKMITIINVYHFILKIYPNQTIIYHHKIRNGLFYEIPSACYGVKYAFYYIFSNWLLCSRRGRRLEEWAGLRGMRQAHIPREKCRR